VTGDDVHYEIDSGPADYLPIGRRGGVEIIYAHELTTYHGTLDALLAIGIERNRLPTGQRGGRWGLCEVPSYASRRQPDGTIVYRVETQARADEKRRKYEVFFGLVPQPAAAPPRPRPQLRLVVDNTRGRS
jgi:hypothetical protein